MKNIEGRVGGLYIGEVKDSLVTTRKGSVKAIFGGLEGDRHFGLTRVTGGRDKAKGLEKGTVIRNERQISIVAQEDLDQIAKNLGIDELPAELIGTNLTFEGVPDLSHLPIGSEIVFSGGVVLKIEEENLPCLKAGKSINTKFSNVKPEDFPKSSINRRGLVASVVSEGDIREGEFFTINLNGEQEPKAT
jgi:hypothetical protein